MMSYVWIFVLGSLIVTGVKMQGKDKFCHAEKKKRKKNFLSRFKEK